LKSGAKVFVSVGAVLFLIGAVLCGSFLYAQAKGLSLFGDTYTVNFVVTGTQWQQTVGYGDNWFQYEVGSFDSASINIAPGDSVYFNVPIGAYRSGDALMYQVLWAVYSGVSEIGGNVKPDSQIPGEYTANEYGEIANAKMTFPAAGTYDVHLVCYSYGLYSGPSATITVNVVAPQVYKTITVGISGQGMVTGGLTSAKISSPAENRFDVHSGDPNYVREYQQFSLLDFTAGAYSGYKFDHWLLNDGSTKTDNPISIILENDMSIQAIFTSQGVLTAMSVGNGYFTIFPGVTDPHAAQDIVYAGQTKTFQHDAGTQIELAAFGNSGSQFDHWVLPDGRTSTSYTESFTMGSTGTVIAYFTSTSSPTATPTQTPSPTETPYPTLPPETPLPTAEPTPIPTNTAQPTVTPTPTPTAAPTSNPTQQPTPTPTIQPSNPTFWIPKGYRFYALLAGIFSLFGSAFCFVIAKKYG